DLFRVFKDGKEFVSFANGEELREKTSHYLKNDEERNLIVRSLYNNVIANHTYDRRAEQILKSLSG
ncbi:MAG: glycosyltransferase, partial [Candidatus Colwellbacteria bacterium]